MGVSLLYHLAEEGCDDILLIEKGELTSGSTVPLFPICNRTLTSVASDKIQTWEKWKLKAANLEHKLFTLHIHDTDLLVLLTRKNWVLLSTLLEAAKCIIIIILCFRYFQAASMLPFSLSRSLSS